MFGFLQKILRGGQDPSFDIDALTAQFLSSLPPCTEYVVMASDKYSEKYKCEVTVNAKNIAPFVKRIAGHTIGGSVESKVSRAAMPIWLDSASQNDGKTSYLPTSFAKITDAYVLNFIHDGIADIHCNECGRSINRIDEDIKNLNVSGPWSEWTDSWYCQAGHLLYSEDHEVHFLRSR
jgi:hypothetical protein